jgi:hypothetical protein
MNLIGCQVCMPTGSISNRDGDKRKGAMALITVASLK